MKVNIKHHKCDMSEKDRELMNNFIKFLQKKYPLKDDITIVFTGERYGDMSTGSRTKDSELKIFTKGRLNRDVARTLAHEWTHERQIKLQMRLQLVQQQAILTKVLLQSQLGIKRVKQVNK